MRFGVLLLVALVAAVSMPGTVTYAEGAVFTVNSAADTTDGSCTGEPGGCTLREAIESANANGNPDVLDRVVFAIPGAGVHTIAIGSGNPPTADLPPVLQPLFIDGSTQQGASCEPRSLRIELDGTAISGAGIGLNLAGAPSVVRGLSIYGANVGVWLQGQGGHVVECSHLGVDAAGVSVRGEGRAMLISSDGNLVGGDEEGSANIIGGFEGIDATDSMGTRVAGNVFGVASDRVTLLDGQVKSGTALRFEGPSDIVFEHNLVAGWDVGVLGVGGSPDQELSPTIRFSTFGLGSAAGPTGPSNRIGASFRGFEWDLIFIRDSSFFDHETAVDVANSRIVQLVGSAVWRSSGCGLSVTGDGNGSSTASVFAGNAYALCAEGDSPSLGATATVIRDGDVGIAYSGSGGLDGSVGVSSSFLLGLGTAVWMSNPGGVSFDENRFGEDRNGERSPNGRDVLIDSWSASPDEFILVKDNEFIGARLTSFDAQGPVELRFYRNVFDLAPVLEVPQLPSPGVRLAGIRALTMVGDRISHSHGPGLLLQYFGQDTRAALHAVWVTGSQGAGFDISTQTAPVWATYITALDNECPGVMVREGTMEIVHGTFDGNDGIPIDLGGDGPTVNDPGDGDTGANLLVNYPLLDVLHLTDRGADVIIEGEIPPGALAARLLIRSGIGCSGGVYGSERLHDLVNIPVDVEQFELEEFVGQARLADGLAVALSYADQAGTWRTSEFSPCEPVAYPNRLSITKVEPPAVKVREDAITARIYYREAGPGVSAMGNGQALEIVDGPVGNPGWLDVSIPPAMLDEEGEIELYLNGTQGEQSNIYTVRVVANALGDQDESGTVDSTDVLCGLRRLAGWYSSDCGDLRDVNLDGAVDLADVLYVRRVAAGLLPE